MKRSDAPREPFRALLITLASFCFAAGFFISSKKFLDLDPGEAVATGRVTVEGVSKAQDYLRFGYLLVIVPFLTVLLIRWLPAIGRRIASVPSGQTPLGVVAFVSAPLILAPFLYLTTYKELWSVLFPPVLAAIILLAWRWWSRSAWLATLFSSSRGAATPLAITEGVAVLIHRYLVTGKRIAHMPSLLLETLFILLFVAAWWVTIALLARLFAASESETPRAFVGIAWGATPLLLLPLSALFPTPTLPLTLAVVFLSALGSILFVKRLAPPRPDAVRSFTAWIGVPCVTGAFSYASSAHISGWIDLFHQGEMLGPASDYLRGKIPYADVVPIHGLLQDGLLDAWLMAWFGRTHEIAIVRATLFESLMLPTVWMLSWVVFRSFPASFAALLSTIVLAADNQRAVPQLVVAILVLGALRSGRRAPLAIAGILSSLALMFSVDIGIYSIAGAVGSFVCLALVDRNRSSLVDAAGKTTWFLAGVLMGILPFLVWFRSLGVVGDFLQTTFVTVPSLIDATWSLPFPDLDDWFAKDLPNGSLFDLAWNLRFVINGLILCIALIVLARAAVERRVGLDERVLATLTVFAIVTQRSALGRADIFHQWFAAFMIAPILVILILRFVARIRAEASPARAAAWAAALLLVPAGFAILWAPHLLEQRLEDTIGFEARRSGAAADPDGEMSTRRVSRVAAAIRERSAPEQPIFDFSNQPAFYFFADRRNPTRFYQVPIFSPLPLQEETVASLSSDPPAVVIMSAPDQFDRFDAVTNRDRAPLVASWIEHHYSPSTRVEGVDLWTRSDPAPSPWEPPSVLPGPHQVALRPHRDARVVFPSVGTLQGADMARWSSDLFLFNPEDVPVEYRLRYRAGEQIRERRYAVGPLHTERIADIAQSLFGLPGVNGALWVLYDPTYPPVARVVTRRDPGTSRGIHALPLRDDQATSGGDLIVTGYRAEPDERINLTVVNFGTATAAVTVQLLDAGNAPLGARLSATIGEEQSHTFVDLATQIGSVVPFPSSFRIDVVSGEVGAQLSIVDGKSGSAELVTAVPIKDDAPR